MTKPPIGQAPGKRAHVEAMFDEIAPRYDLLNRVLSFGIDVWWRKRAVALLADALDERPEFLLDVATGTGDLAIEALSLDPDQVVGVDISAGMLAGGRDKLRQRGLDGAADVVRLAGVDGIHQLGGGQRHMQQVSSPGKRSKTKQTSQVVVQTGFSVLKPGQAGTELGLQVQPAGEEGPSRQDHHEDGTLIQLGIRLHADCVEPVIKA